MAKDNKTSSSVPGLETETLESLMSKKSNQAERSAAPQSPSPAPSAEPETVAAAVEPPKAPPPAPPAPAPSAPVAASAKRYLVLDTIDVPRGASSFRLPKGKIISAMGYDIAYILSCGAKLEELKA